MFDIFFPLRFPSIFLFLCLPPFFTCQLTADTKRKVEQISEELRSLDEMLAGNEGTDGTVEVTADETSLATSDEPNQPDGQGVNFNFFFFTIR